MKLEISLIKKMYAASTHLVLKRYKVMISQRTNELAEKSEKLRSLDVVKRYASLRQFVKVMRVYMY